MKLLVTGASGRLGRAICHCLRNAHDVVGFDRLASPGTDIVAPLADTARLRAALRGVDAVVHAAALHAPHVGVHDDAAFHEVNVEGTRSLARLCLDAGVRHLVFTSTTALYGAASTPTSRAGWVTEATVPLPRTIYHRSKLAAEMLLQELAAREALAVTVLRVSRCFPEPAPEMAIYRLHRGVSAPDVAAAHAAALRLPASGYRCLIVSAATPFVPDDAEELVHDAAAVVARRAPEVAEAFGRRGWPLPRTIDRVYVAAQARDVLGWQSHDGFAEVLAALHRGASEVLPPRVK